jgi:hypothetical protein
LFADALTDYVVGSLDGSVIRTHTKGSMISVKTVFMYDCDSAVEVICRTIFASEPSIAAYIGKETVALRHKVANERRNLPPQDLSIRQFAVCALPSSML